MHRLDVQNFRIINDAVHIYANGDPLEKPSIILPIWILKQICEAAFEIRSNIP